MTIEAARRGLPPDTLFAALQAATRIAEGLPIALSRVSLGNMTALDIALLPLTEDVGGVSGAPAREGYVLVSVPNHGAYALHLAGPLHWSYVEEHLIHNRCDATALTLFLAPALHREPLIEGACDCGRHGIEAQS